MEQSPGWSIPVSELTDNPEKFIKAVKYLITGEWIKDICFSSDYKIIKKDEEFIGFKQMIRESGEAFKYNGITYNF